MPCQPFRRFVASALAVAPLIALSQPGHAQSRVGSDSATRLTRFGRAVAYGTITGLGFALIDQWANAPSEWGRGWSGYGKRAASDLGQFYIQEGTSEGLAAVMNRPLDYARCKCQGLSNRVWWAVSGAVLDPMPNGTRLIAVPRITGAYTGSFAQATWRPSGAANRFGNAVLAGTTSLGLGALINLFYEFRRPPPGTKTVAGERKP